MQLVTFMMPLSQFRKKDLMRTEHFTQPCLLKVNPKATKVKK